LTYGSHYTFFGATKGMFGGYLEERTEKMAFNVVFAQLALWNIGNILFVFFVTLRCKKNFQTASPAIDFFLFLVFSFMGGSFLLNVFSIFVDYPMRSHSFQFQLKIVYPPY